MLNLDSDPQLRVNICWNVLLPVSTKPARNSDRRPSYALYQEIIVFPVQIIEPLCNRCGPLTTASVCAYQRGCNAPRRESGLP
ncbi:hypothetical protein TNCV_1500761 [Trichonephila clavipes]|nr:hypothetical protein TNCV_1500761 [Trichonephila clavipes]